MEIETDCTALGYFDYSEDSTFEKTCESWLVCPANSDFKICTKKKSEYIYTEETCPDGATCEREERYRLIGCSNGLSMSADKTSCICSSGLYGDDDKCLQPCSKTTYASGEIPEGAITKQCVQDGTITNEFAGCEEGYVEAYAATLGDGLLAVLYSGYSTTPTCVKEKKCNTTGLLTSDPILKTDPRCCRPYKTLNGYYLIFERTSDMSIPSGKICEAMSLGEDYWITDPDGNETFIEVTCSSSCMLVEKDLILGE